MHLGGLESLTGTPLPFGGAHDFLPKRGVAPRAGLQRVRRRSQHGGAIARASCLTNRIGAAVEVERHLREALRTRTHVLTHLLHLWRRLDQCRCSRDFLPVLASEAIGDALDGHEVLHHVLLLVPRHHRLQGNRRALVEGRQVLHGLTRAGRRQRLRLLLDSRRRSVLVLTCSGGEYEKYCDSGNQQVRFHSPILQPPLRGGFTK